MATKKNINTNSEKNTAEVETTHPVTGSLPKKGRITKGKNSTTSISVELPSEKPEKKTKKRTSSRKKVEEPKPEPIEGEVIGLDDKKDVPDAQMVPAIATKPEDILLTPSEYFHTIKHMMDTNTEENMQRLLSNAVTLMKKPVITGQSRMARNIYNTTQVLMKEMDAVKAGFTLYVKRETILYYIDKVAKKVAKIIDIKDYEREIPDDVFDRLIGAKEIFDDFVIVFTDYTGESERKIEKRNRDKDPILFGLFKMPGTSETIYFPRFYFIGDWVDEYCDLTLDKMIEEYRKATGETATDFVPDYISMDDVREALKDYEKTYGDDTFKGEK